MKLSTILALVALSLFIGLGLYLAPLKPGVLHLQFAFSERSFDAILSKWQDIGVARYRSHFPVDFLFLITYGIAGFRFGQERATALANLPKIGMCITWALPVAAVADATENVLHLILTAAHPPTISALYLLSGAAASIKWVGTFTFLGSVVLYKWKKAG